MNTLLLWKYFALSFSALIPLVNPIGSALIIVGFVGPVPIEFYRKLARRIAINTLIFFAIIQLIGSAILNFFGISLPIVQVSGGLVIAAMGWGLLNKASDESNEKKQQISATADDVSKSLAEKSFYPYTFPLTVGPGCIVVTLTLSAQATQHTLTGTFIAHGGIMLAALITCVLVYICYANAPRITRSITPSTSHGIVRVIAFFLLCIGVQIAWNGLSALLTPLIRHP